MKALGYLISTISVFLLGAVAWPPPGEPRWKVIAVVVGMAASIVGMGLRYLSHRKDRQRIDESRNASRLRQTQYK
jgi:hypothetical protein